MDQDILKPFLAGFVRHLATSAGGYLVAVGVTDKAGAQAFVGAVMVLAGIGWSWWQKAGQKQVADMLKKVTAKQTTEAAVKVAAKVPAGSAVTPGLPRAAVTALLAVLALAALTLLTGSASAAVKKASAPAATPSGKVTKAEATSNPVVVLQTFTVNDLQAALADANAQTPPDTVAAACYSALIPIVQSGVANPLPKGLGAFQALQKARDLKAALANLQSPTGPLASLNTACAPLILDAQNTLIQLGILGGGVVATSGLVLPLKLPIPLPF